MSFFMMSLIPLNSPSLVATGNVMRAYATFTFFEYPFWTCSELCVDIAFTGCLTLRFGRISYRQKVTPKTGVPLLVHTRTSC